MSKKPIDPNAGQRLREVRKHRGISQAELAKAVGLEVGAIQGYEHARIGISATRLEQLARGLQCEPADLMMPPGAPLPRYGGRRFARPKLTAEKASLFTTYFLRCSSSGYIDPFAANP